MSRQQAPLLACNPPPLKPPHTQPRHLAKIAKVVRPKERSARLAHGRHVQHLPRPGDKGVGVVAVRGAEPGRKVWRPRVAPARHPDVVGQHPVEQRGIVQLGVWAGQGLARTSGGAQVHGHHLAAGRDAAVGAPAARVADGLPGRPRRQQPRPLQRRKEPRLYRVGRALLPRKAVVGVAQVQEL